LSFSSQLKKLELPFIFLFLNLLSTAATAQFSERIATGRPGQANGPFSVGKAIYQIQTGIDFGEKTTEDDQLVQKRGFVSNASTFRVGIKEDVELRANYQFQIKDKTIQPTEGSQQNGFRTLGIGVRQFLFEQNRLLPAFGLQLTLLNQGFQKSKQLQHSDLELRIIAQHRISPKLSLNTNLSFRRSLHERETISPYVLSFRYLIHEKWRIVWEAYGTIRKRDISLLYDIGLGYFINKNFQLDLYGGYAENKVGEFGPEINEWFVSSGLSYRLNKRP
jgi:hypothetical protein